MANKLSNEIKKNLTELIELFQENTGHEKMTRNETRWESAEYENYSVKTDDIIEAVIDEVEKLDGKVIDVVIESGGISVNEELETEGGYELTVTFDNNETVELEIDSSDFDYEVE